MTNMNKRYNNANEAYEALLHDAIALGVDFDDTKALFNCGFTMTNPQDNKALVSSKSTPNAIAS